MKINKLDIEYFIQNTEFIAKDLLGTILYKNENGIILSGKIVETEAYLPFGDLANHCSAGLTNRTKPMFEKGGILYVYKIYGLYNCINFVTEKEGLGCAVLIRAVEPLDGIDIMRHRRNTNDLYNLCSGPGKLAQAFNFSREYNFHSLNSEEVYLIKSSDEDSDIIQTTRIGIKKSADLKLRFYLKNSRFISKK